jgi:hypothetical protein
LIVFRSRAMVWWIILAADRLTDWFLLDRFFRFNCVALGGRSTLGTNVEGFVRGLAGYQSNAFLDCHRDFEEKCWSSVQLSPDRHSPFF